MTEGNGGEVIELEPKRRRTVAEKAEGIVESVWTRMVTRGAMVVIAVLAFFGQREIAQFDDQFRDLRSDQKEISQKIEAVSGTLNLKIDGIDNGLNDKVDRIDKALNDKMADVIANQAAGLADRNAQAGQIASLKQDLKDQGEALGNRISRLGDKIFEIVKPGSGK